MRECEQCGEPLRRKDYEKPNMFARRRFCDCTCAARFRANSKPVERDCKHCQKPLVRRDDEHGSNFAKRIFCNRECGFAWRKAQAVQKVDKPKPKPALFTDEITPAAIWAMRAI